MPETIRLPHKPDAPLSYQLVPGQGPLSTTHLVVFLNGLIAPQSAWLPSIRALQQRWDEHRRAADVPSLLTYDRYGQGESARDPADALHGGSHDICEIVADLRVLVHETWRTRIVGVSGSDAPVRTPKLVFVSNSIGCVIGRFYAEKYPGTTAGLLFLDSNIANSDLVSLFPDPDAADFDPSALPPDSTVEDLRRTRAGYAAQFQPSAPNPEHWDRRNIMTLVPLSDGPALEGAPWITVVGHDWETFAEEGLRGSMKVPKGLTNKYMNTPWAAYNEGLTHLTDAHRARGPVIAVGCGHFIQKDDPLLVAELTDDLIRKVERDGVA
ncbi:alpha/beta-hydrolase [Daldinia sp. FL1419]|nr:alpha/beta-hydrolase [Daldinia sp. FL1419]